MLEGYRTIFKTDLNLYDRETHQRSRSPLLECLCRCRRLQWFPGHSLSRESLVGFVSRKNVVHGEITNSGRSSVKTIFHEFLDCRLEVDDNLTGRDTMYTSRANRLNRPFRHPDRQTDVAVRSKSR